MDSNFNFNRFDLYTIDVKVLQDIGDLKNGNFLNLQDNLIFKSFKDTEQIQNLKSINFTDNEIKNIENKFVESNFKSENQKDSFSKIIKKNYLI